MRDCPSSPSRSVVFGREPHEFLKIRVVGPPRDYWVPCRISVAQSGLAGSFDIELWTHDFDRLQADLSRIFQDMRGFLEFRPIQEQLSFTIQGDGRGQFLLRGQATFDQQLGPWIRFEILFDQTEIPPMLAEIKELRESLA